MNINVSMLKIAHGESEYLTTERLLKRKEIKEQYIQDLLIDLKTEKLYPLPDYLLDDILRSGLVILGSRGTGKSNAGKIIMSQIINRPDLNIQCKITDTCFDKHTEILTLDGWKKFEDISEDEIVVTRNSENNIEYQRITKKIKQKTDKLFIHNGRNMNFAVSSGHEFIVKQFVGRGGKNPIEKIVTIEELMKTSLRTYIPLTAEWVGNEVDNFILEPIKKWEDRNIVIEEKIIKMDDWLRFFGIWLAEGCTSKNGAIRIDQKKGERADIIREWINKIGYRVNEREYLSSLKKTPMVCFTINNKQLYNYLSQFGKARDKYIPNHYLLLSKRQLMILFDSMKLGDCTKDGYRYSTHSKKLADNVQEILLKISKFGNIHKQDGGYIITLSNRTHSQFFRENVEIKEYNDYVYCVSVPNQIIYVRRNGKVMWTHNCQNLVHGFEPIFYQHINYDTRVPDDIYFGDDHFLYDIELSNVDEIKEIIGMIATTDFELQREYKKEYVMDNWILYCIEEAQNVIGTHALNGQSGKAWLKMISESRNFNMNFIFIAQRLADVSTKAVERCQGYLMGRMTGDNDLKKVQRICGKEIDVSTIIPKLELGEYIYWNGIEAIRIVDTPKYDISTKPIKWRGGMGI